MAETQNVAVNGYHGGFNSQLPSEQLPEVPEAEAEIWTEG